MESFVYVCYSKSICIQPHSWIDYHPLTMVLLDWSSKTRHFQVMGGNTQNNQGSRGHQGGGAVGPVWACVSQCSRSISRWRRSIEASRMGGDGEQGGWLREQWPGTLAPISTQEGGHYEGSRCCALSLPSLHHVCSVPTAPTHPQDIRCQLWWVWGSNNITQVIHILSQSKKSFASRTYYWKQTVKRNCERASNWKRVIQNHKYVS